MEKHTFKPFINQWNGNYKIVLTDDANSIYQSQQNVAKVVIERNEHSITTSAPPEMIRH